jgi:P-type E1-E2 ATPase
MAAIGQAARHGVLIKSGEALEKMGRVDCIAFDKTGTLTCGKIEVSDIIVMDKDYHSDELLRLAASVESCSEHPLGKALMQAAETEKLEIAPAAEVEIFVGNGVSGQVEGHKILCGNAAFLQQNNIDIPDGDELDTLRSQGKVLVFTAVDGKCIGMIALSDIIRSEAAEAVAELHDLQVTSVLLTGDHKQTAAFLAGAVKLNEVKAELLPADKVNEINILRQTKCVAMVGDGVNDAPALKTADVGIAMASIGSDIAV